MKKLGEVAMCAAFIAAACLCIYHLWNDSIGKITVEHYDGCYK